MSVDTAGRGGHRRLYAEVSVKTRRRTAVCILHRKGGENKTNTACAAVRISDERFCVLIISVHSAKSVED